VSLMTWISYRQELLLLGLRVGDELLASVLIPVDDHLDELVVSASLRK
jgi:hypothetical protein